MWMVSWKPPMCAHPVKWTAREKVQLARVAMPSNAVNGKQLLFGRCGKPFKALLGGQKC